MLFCTTKSFDPHTSIEQFVRETDGPIFVIGKDDPTASRTMRAWADFAESDGSISLEQISAARQIADELDRQERTQKALH